MLPIIEELLQGPHKINENAFATNIEAIFDLVVAQQPVDGCHNGISNAPVQPAATKANTEQLRYHLHQDFVGSSSHEFEKLEGIL